MSDNREAPRDQRATPATSSTKPGERTPPTRVAPVRSRPESDKKPGAGGAPSPVGENDLA